MKKKNSFLKKLTHILCYAAPIGFIAFIIFRNIGLIPSNGLTSSIPFLFLLLCPLSHLLMFPLMHKAFSKDSDRNGEIEENSSGSCH